jgi:hypothetical protein
MFYFNKDFIMENKKARMVSFETMYDGRRTAYQSTGQKDLFFYVVSENTGCELTMYSVTMEVKGFPPSEAYSEWFVFEEDALKLCKLLAEGRDVYCVTNT